MTLLIIIYCLIAIVTCIYLCITEIESGILLPKIIKVIILLLISFALWPVIIFLHFSYMIPSKHKLEKSPRRISDLPPDWLLKKISISEAETSNTYSPFNSRSAPVPFGCENATWVDIKSKMVEGDEIWMFSTPPEYWKNRCGRGGVCIVHNKTVIDGIITVLN